MNDEMINNWIIYVSHQQTNTQLDSQVCTIGRLDIRLLLVLLRIDLMPVFCSIVSTSFFYCYYPNIYMGVYWWIQYGFQIIYIINVMYQGYSQNNLLIGKDEQCNQQPYADNFHDSIVMTPIQLNPTHFKSTQNLKTRHLNSISKGGLGAYQPFKLTLLLSRGLNQQQNLINIGLYNKNQEEWRNGNLVEVATIDQDSCVSSISSKFKELMNKYASMDVCFVTVVGEKDVGKSFFCDKILNLAEIKGSHYYHKDSPGIYTYSVPFVKDGLYVFLLEIAGCSLNSDVFQHLNSLIMMLSSAYIFIGDLDSQSANKSILSLRDRLKQLSNVYETKEQHLHEFLHVQNLYFLQRLNKQGKVPDNLSSPEYKIFKSLESKYLPDGMVAGYRGNKLDLTTCSFQMKQCISSAYIQAISQIFKSVFKQIRQKKYEDLILTGDIANKLLSLLVININSQNKINIQNIFDKILTELYISAYNYCVVGYHDQLEQYFDDEEPKNSDQMYEVFEKASDNALDKFNQFRLNQELHDKYYQKLLAHIESKELLLCNINYQKTKQLLMEQFDKIMAESNGDFRTVISKMKNFRKELNQGREECYTHILAKLYRSDNKGEDPTLVRKFNQLTQENQRLEREVQKMNKANQKQAEDHKKMQDQMDLLIRQQKQLDKELKKIEEQLSSGIMKIDAEGLQKMRKQIEILNEKEVDSLRKFNDFQSQNSKAAISQLRQSHQQKIKAIITKQNQVQKQLEQVLKSQKKENPQTKSPVKQAQPNDKLKNSEVKKQSKQSKQPSKKSEIKPPKAKK